MTKSQGGVGEGGRSNRYMEVFEHAQSFLSLPLEKRTTSYYPVSLESEKNVNKFPDLLYFANFTNSKEECMQKCMIPLGILLPGIRKHKIYYTYIITILGDKDVHFRRLSTHNLTV